MSWAFAFCEADFPEVDMFGQKFRAVRQIAIIDEDVRRLETAHDRAMIGGFGNDLPRLFLPLQPPE